MFFLSPVKGGVDAKELFHLYIMVWIQDKRLSLLESCKLDKVKCIKPWYYHMYSLTPYACQILLVLLHNCLDGKQSSNFDSSKLFIF